MGSGSVFGLSPQRSDGSRPSSEQSTYTPIKGKVKNNFVNYANSRIISIPEDSLKLVLTDVLKKHDAWVKVLASLSWTLSLALSGFGTLNIRLTFWMQDFTLSTVFFVLSICSLYWVLKSLIVFCRKGFTTNFDFAEAVFQTIEQKYGTSKAEDPTTR